MIYSRRPKKGNHKAHEEDTKCTKETFVTFVFPFVAFVFRTFRIILLRFRLPYVSLFFRDLFRARMVSARPGLVT